MKPTEKISIVSMASISPLGFGDTEVWSNYQKDTTLFKDITFDKFNALVGEIDSSHWQAIYQLRDNPQYSDLDPSVLLAIEVSRRALLKTDWSDQSFGINIGSSRGATNLFEKYYREFLEDSKGRVSTLSSPTTTLGNISSWVGHDLQSDGPTISHSITCSTALHAVLNGIAWIHSGMTNRFLVGGCEASNTPFTLAQMKSLKIYTDEISEYPCKVLDLEKKKNTMILGEGAAVFCLEKGKKQNALAIIKGVGYATEPLKHNISISTNADCFQTSMQMALGNTNFDEIDVIVMHAPGTVKGDVSEYNAIRAIFKNKLPALTSNKWKIGHTLGASGGLSLELAILMMQHQKFIKIPFIPNQHKPTKIKNVLVNAVGFGGNAVSILLSLD